MGYFSQRKKHERVNSLLNVILAVLALLTVLSFFDNSGIRLIDLFGFWRFHYYIITLVVLVYALISGFFIHAFLALLILIVNYVTIASSANLFSNVNGSGSRRIAVVYQNNTREIEPLVKDAARLNAEIIGINHHLRLMLSDKEYGKYKIFHENAGLEKSFILTDKTPLRAGKLRLTPKRTASFLTFNQDGRNFIFINVDFMGIEAEEEKVVFDNLAEFVLNQDNPVIIVGDFGLPAWSGIFKEFLNRTGLEVKNRVLMTDGRRRLNFFTVPAINVLAYRDVGLGKVEVLPEIRGSRPFFFELNF